MEIIPHRFENGLLVEVRGRLDNASSPLLTQELETLVGTPAPDSVLAFECSRLDYIASAGLRVFMTQAKKFKVVSKHPVALISLNPMLKEIIEISGFNAILQVTESTEGLALGKASGG